MSEQPFDARGALASSVPLLARLDGLYATIPAMSCDRRMLASLTPNKVRMIFPAGE